jgi:aminoglycoside 6-adenylyltransferase
MMDLILSTALVDERIRAVILNGSRVNPNIEPDRFSDFDVIYIVTEIESFLSDEAWIDRFGERMILQTPDLMGGPKVRIDGGFTWLMQFMDGNRIDLTLIPISHLKQMEEDSLSVLLLDKDDLFEPFPAPSEASYLPEPPTEKAFFECCNEFWWVSPYVAKALARGQILYAKRLLEDPLRVQLMKALTWLFGFRTDFRRSAGKGGSRLRGALTEAQWGQLLATYAPAESDPTWDALFAMGALFRAVAGEVADKFGFDYPEKEDRAVSQYLKEIRES